ncbi:hypothetical protein GE061_016610 [Apolygus lucorum]|uniref:Uncharacterized protein n=1 Tax=Apolygus lucorum TaxID=248454 RepID=A0A8S9XHU9_APOLU|nr:hypothetical protein GE061_016610 [Apolygus lucorum]
MLLYIVNTHPNLKSIEHKFLWSGHTQMEADSMHSAIESAEANVPVYSVQGWMMIMRMARSARNNEKCKPYHVRELKFGDMVDLKKLSAMLMTNRLNDKEGEKVSWLRIERLKFIKGSNTILFSYNYFGNYSEQNPSGGRNGISYPDSLGRLNKGYLPISRAKKKDLLKLCKTGAIPAEYHNW